jgi:hypothetical protein
LNSIGIPILKELRIGNELENYVEKLNNTHDRLALGYALMLNYASYDDNTSRFTKKTNSSTYSLPGQYKFIFNNESSNDVNYITNWTIFKGDQLFIDYGDNWFSSRDMEAISVRTLLDRDVLHVDDVHSDNNNDDENDNDDNNEYNDNLRKFENENKNKQKKKNNKKIPG